MKGEAPVGANRRAPLVTGECGMQKHSASSELELQAGLRQISVGRGRYAPNCSTRLTPDLATVAAHVEGLRGVDAWWSPSTFESNYRCGDNWRSSIGVGVDVDYHVGEMHASLPEDYRTVLEELAAESDLPGSFVYLTPRGLRIFFLFDAPCLDRALVERAHLGAARVVHEEVYGNGLEIDTGASHDLARMWFAPNANVDGEQRQSRIIQMNRDPFSVDHLASKAPALQEVAEASGVDLKRAIELLTPLWTEGRRHALALALSAFVLTRGLSRKVACTLIEQLESATSDPDIQDRVRALSTTHERLKQHEPCLSRSILEPALGTAGLEELERALRLSWSPARSYLPVIQDEKGRLLLHRWRGEWYRYRDGVWLLLSDEHLDVELRKHLHALDEGDFKTTRNTISEAIAELRALDGVMLDDAIEPPCRVSGEPLERSFVVVSNGILDLDRGEVVEHTPELWSLVKLPVSWEGPEAEAPTFDRFLEAILPDDVEAQETLTEWMGYVVSGRMEQEKFLLMVGPKRGGKGTFTRTLEALLGGASTNTNLRDLARESFALSEWPSSLLAVLPDVRNTGRSAGEQSHAVETLLTVIGRDAVRINQKYKQERTMRVPTRIMIVGNEPPLLLDDSEALRERTLAIALGKSWAADPDLTLKDRLLDELPGVLARAVQGYQRLYARGRFVQPESGRELLEDLTELASPVRSYLGQVLVMVEALADGPPNEGWLHEDTEWEQWRRWCGMEGRPTGSKGMHWRALKALGLKRVRPQVESGPRPYYWKGIALQEKASGAPARFLTALSGAAS